MIEEMEKVYTAVLEAIRAGESAALVTVIEAKGSTPRGVSAKMLVYADKRTVGTVGGGGVEARAIDEALAAIKASASRELAYDLVNEERGDPGVCGGSMRLFVEVLAPRPTLLILGGGHVGQAVAELGAFLGFRIVVADDRPDLVTEERFPWADSLLAGDMAEQVAEFPLDEHTYLIMVTPHYATDEKVLEVLVDHKVAYVGMIGSRRRSTLTFQRAREAGVPEELLARVHTPIGLDIDAQTPREIAVSIVAEVIGVQRGHREADRQSGK
jgi:xanthine dehydrogenase accessory factor